ncbi:hypothetical protein [Virgibacillus halodenitrificans]|uniref:Uncharacterized protein n=1 Tax=Virgibacillus halodenitrificans TaxID=1482 RepID=A0ABR7VIZ3_VIRHA|nr:hypothetical protein [Virgibacillus halodenitrificans]MBD1221894.1 hypothetical protein [Virgibacillus halodenitrificans]
MGFWYLLLLLIGVVFIVLSLIKIKSVGVTKKTGTLLTLGAVVIVASIFLLTPGSSEVIANLLNLQ